MNINLGTNYPIDEDGEPVSFQSDIEEHHEILRSADIPVTNRTILLSDPDPAYPGAYQVWTQTNDHQWVWIDPDGVAVLSACPIGD